MHHQSPLPGAFEPLRDGCGTSRWGTSRRMHVESIRCSFTPVWMGPARLDQEFRPATVRCTRRTHCTLPFTRGTLMRVRADETNTLEISAGHSPVDGAHSSAAGGRAGLCRGGL